MERVCRVSPLARQQEGVHSELALLDRKWRHARRCIYDVSDLD